MANLIRGINPLIISGIVWNPGRRLGGGKHPFWYKLSKKKHPILWKLGILTEQELLFGSSFWNAEVVIHDSDGSRLLSIKCKSNAEAEQLCGELTKTLDKFLDSVRMDIT